MSGTQALVLAGHGSQRHARSAAPVHGHADRIREAGVFDEVRSAFWKEEPTLGAVATTVESDEAYVVPVLTSEGYFADQVFPRELGPADEGPGPAVHYAEPVGTHPSMTDVVRARVESTRTGPADGVGVVVVGHGTERNPRSARSTRRHARRLRERDRYAEAAAVFLDEPPYVDDALDHVTASEVVVVPLFVADGYHTTADVPAALGHPGVGEAVELDGRLVHYTGAVGTEPRLADVIVERAVEAGADLGEGATASTLGDADAAFLRRVEGQDGPLAWGELSVDTDGDEFVLRHRSDRASPVESLERLEDPRALREHVRHADDGRYRPLSGAENLPSGWVLDGLEATDLVRAVRFVYPGAIPHWYHDRRGDLAVTDFRATVDRQTGIYADLDELDPRERETLTEAVCGDCVRNRRWGIGDAEAPPAEGGAIPCREACPFLLSAAHGVLDSGRDAAAEPGADVPLGAFEDPANRYRVRYARALDRRRSRERAPVATGGDD